MPVAIMKMNMNRIGISSVKTTMTPTAAIALMMAAGVHPEAQGKPDFSGKWVMADPSPAAGDAGAGAGRGGGRAGGRGAGFQPGFGPEITLNHTKDGIYEGEADLSMGGEWQAKVSVEQEGHPGEAVYDFVVMQ